MGSEQMESKKEDAKSLKKTATELDELNDRAEFTYKGSPGKMSVPSKRMTYDER